MDEYESYETVIGLEVHIELATKTKIFCDCTTEFGGEPNTHCCPICIGMPGTLPVLNKKVVEYAVAAVLAMNGTVTKLCHFDRKHYFYPDLPKAYQVSQLYLPIGKNGNVEIEVDGKKKTIVIHEIHMEEDAGKLIHDSKKDVTLINYNRCGVPLIEIVSEPDMRSAVEVLAYLEKLKRMLQYLGVSDCKMQEGSLRADINLSVRKQGSECLGTRTEMKNLNSFKAITRAIESERKRQIILLEQGKEVIQETRRWDDRSGISVAMRSKEAAKDYRYFPEPDLMPIKLEEAWLEELRHRLPEMPEEKRERYMREYGLPHYDADILTSSKTIADLFEETTALCGQPKEVSNWLMIEAMRLLKETGREPEELAFSPKNLASLIHLLKTGSINRTVAKEVFEQIFKENIDPEQYVKKQGLQIIQDTELLQEVIQKTMKANPQSIVDYQKGKKKAMGFLVGQVMKELKGKADPSFVNQMVKQELEKNFYT